MFGRLGLWTVLLAKSVAIDSRHFVAIFINFGGKPPGFSRILLQFGTERNDSCMEGNWPEGNRERERESHWQKMLLNDHSSTKNLKTSTCS